MTKNGWTIKGEFLCPCITSNLSSLSRQGDCKAAVAVRIDKGEEDGVTLDDLAFVVAGSAGGPMAAPGPRVGRVAGVERRPVQFVSSGLSRSVTDGNLLDQALEGVPRGGDPNIALAVDNTVDPVNSRLSLARDRRSVFRDVWHGLEEHRWRAQWAFAAFAWSAWALRGRCSLIDVQSPLNVQRLAVQQS